MSRRTATTLAVQVRLRIPPGSNMTEVLDYIRSALCSHKTSGDPALPINSIDTDSLVVKLEKKETVYL